MSNEPSVEDILSSIKRIMSEETEAAAGAPAPRGRRLSRGATAVRTEPDVLELDEPIDGDAVDHDDDDQEDPVPQPRAAHSARSAAAVDDRHTPRPRETILSEEAAEASRDSLAALSRLVVKPEAPGADTLEGLVREMLRPMLRSWLDDNLPRVVEELVAKEIARITGR